MEYLAWERRAQLFSNALRDVREDKNLICLAIETQSLHGGYRDVVLLHYNQWLSNN